MIKIRRRASSHALLVSLIIHLCFAIAVTIVLYRHEQEKFEDTVAIEFLSEKKLPKPRRTLKPPPKRIVTRRQVRSPVEDQPQNVRLKASANLINETLRPSEKILLHDATDNKLNIQDELPDVMTAAGKIHSREVTIPEEVSSRFQTSDGEGMESFRQRAAGNGSGGIHALESTGTADVGIVEMGPDKKGKGSGTSKSDNPFAQALRNIADHIIATRKTDKVNIVFVLDTSASMRDNIQQVADHLYSMTDAYDEINLEYHLGMIQFSVRREGQRLKMRSLMPDVGTVRRQMKNVRLSGDEHALDALVETLDLMDFHSDADKHLVLVTDEAATTESRKSTALTDMRAKVISDYNSEEIHVNVLGHTEAYQKRLAEDTGGLWQEIPGGLVQTASLPTSRRANQAFVKFFRDIVVSIRRSSGRVLFSMELEFQRDLDDTGNLISKPILHAFGDSGHPLSGKAAITIQQAGSRWLIVDGLRSYAVMKTPDKINFYGGVSPEVYAPKATVDLVIMLDYSRSMGGKSEAIMLGISELIGKLDILPIRYQIRLIRFAEPKDAIKSINGTDVTPIPLNESQIKTLMEEPFGGDEHLIDAIVEGLPQIPFRPNANRFILVLTDEPTTGNFPPERALGVCEKLNIRAYVIGTGSIDDSFQVTLAQQTGGQFFPMPKGFSKTYPYQ
ncbi:VWA domain-containing protein [Candidatus Poribacteria bacterium]|nr:VWA domain-containing protein [Candidatus Poribacteria bacterium]